MRKVLIWGRGGDRGAIELRWVREVFTLGPVTPIPTAPPAVAGAVNFRGTILPVLFGPALLAVGGKVHAPRAGHSAVLLDVDDTSAALAVDRIDEVTTLEEQDGVLVDVKGREVTLADPGAILRAARQQVIAAAGEHGPRS